MTDFGIPNDAYLRLIAAQRVPSDEELRERAEQDERDRKAFRIRRKLKTVY